ncbi:MAG: pentapeptide repeat-containing protein [Planctomycetota bacterium]|nr:pentapeptide repeat-containing protein [Planctomycetota bacterium]
MPRRRRGRPSAASVKDISYASGELTEVVFAYNDMTGWNFSGKNLTNADFWSATLSGADFSGANLTDAIFNGATLAGANFSGATILGGNFVGTTFGGFTQEQFESTASYISGELAGVILYSNIMTGWNFASKNLTDVNFMYPVLSSADFSSATLSGANLKSTVLTDADFTGATLTNADLTSVDARGATGMAYTQAANTTNFIRPDRRVAGLNVGASELFFLRDYDGLDTNDDGTPDTPLGITVGDGFSVNDTGRLFVYLEDGDWGSTVAFDTGIPVDFDGTLQVSLIGGYSPTFGE